MKIKVFEVSTVLERVLFIFAFIIAFAILGILIWKFVSPFLAIVISAFASYLFYLREFLRKKK